MPRSDWDNAANILCVRLDSLGDVLMTEPAMRALKASLPGRRVTLLTSAEGAKAAELLPSVDGTLTYAAPWMKHAATCLPEADREFIQSLAQHRFDAAAIFTVYTQSALPAALMCHLAGIPWRLAHCRENPYQLITDWIPDQEPQHGVRHEVRRQLDLVSLVGAAVDDDRIQVNVSRSAKDQALLRLVQSGIRPCGRWAVLHPGASAPSRRYPPELFARAADLLVQGGCQVVFTGTDAERELVETIRAAMQEPSCSLTGRLNLMQLAGVLQLAPLLISNNSGPVHLAAAVGTPLVDLYALTNPQHTPWRVPHRVLSHEVPCKYCYKSLCPLGHHDCLARVTPESVVAAAMELLAETAPASQAKTVRRIASSV